MHLIIIILIIFAYHKIKTQNKKFRTTMADFASFLKTNLSILFLSSTCTRLMAFIHCVASGFHLTQLANTLTLVIFFEPGVLTRLNSNTTSGYITTDVQCMNVGIHILFQWNFNLLFMLENK